MSNVGVSRPVPGLIAEKLRDPGTKAPKGRYRFTPSSLGRDTGCGRPFNSVFDLTERVKKHGMGAKKSKSHCFVLLTSLFLDDHSR